MWIFQQKSLNCVEHPFVCNLGILEPKEIMQLPFCETLISEVREGKEPKNLCERAGAAVTTRGWWRELSCDFLDGNFPLGRGCGLLWDSLPPRC